MLSRNSGAAGVNTGIDRLLKERPLARLRAGLTVLKAAALLVLPLPLLIVIAAALIGDNTRTLTLAAAALASFWGAGVLTWRGLTTEMRYTLGDQIALTWMPRKLSGALLTGLGAGLAALTAGHSPIGSLVFAALGGAGHLCFYGLDMRAGRLAVTKVEGLDVTSIGDQLEEAHLRLRRIDAASHAIAVPEFRVRLARITSVGREILAEIARDPHKAARARRFLNLFLDSTERVTGEYARTHTGLRSRPLEDNFRTLLVDMERTFSEQHRALLESDAVALDVEMAVLDARLKQDAPGHSGRDDHERHESDDRARSASARG
jgi:5-bromo-4-chloroindolyl phosphate hydrolysis protein